MSANNQSKQSDTVALTGLPDEQLLVLFKQGDERRRQRVIGIFYKRYAPAVLQMAHRLAASRDQALEIFSEVWSRVCQKLPHFEWRGTPLLHWLLRITKYVRLEIQRRSKQESHLLEFLEETHQTAADPAPEMTLDSSSARPEPAPVSDTRLVRALRQLKPLERKIVVLLYFKNKNSTQIGHLLGMTPAAVRQRHKRILVKLRLGLI